MININNDKPLSSKNYSDPFTSELVVKNKESIAAVKKLFAEALKDLDQKDFCLFLTGSDGRLEKAGVRSPFELIVVFKKEMTNEEQEKVKERINLFVKERSTEFDDIVEYKVDDERAPLLKYEEKVIPTRASDSKKIWGDNELKKSYYKKVFEQLKNMPTKEYVKFSASFRKNSAKELRKIQENDSQTHVSTSKAELIFDNKRNLATKYPMLRPIQYHVAHMIYKEIRSGRVGAEEFEKLRKMRGINRKLEYLTQRKIVKADAGKLEEIMKAYSRSLQWYVEAQVHYQETQEQRLAVNKQELDHVVTVIETFLEDNSDKKNSG